jgi:hypothetical protein
VGLAAIWRRTSTVTILAARRGCGSGRGGREERRRARPECASDKVSDEARVVTRHSSSPRVDRSTGTCFVPRRGTKSMK